MNTLLLDEWRPVVGWEGMYEVSRTGQVRVLDRVLKAPRRQQRFSGAMIYGIRSGNSYASIMLRCSERIQFTSIHSLVAEAFHGVRPLDHVVNHINGRKACNRASNLEYVTHRANNLHALWTGLKVPARGHKLRRIKRIRPLRLKGARDRNHERSN